MSLRLLQPFAFVYVLFLTSVPTLANDGVLGPDGDVVLPQKPDAPPTIDFWYGEQQRFGNLGDTHPMINIIGSIQPAHHAADVWYQLNRDKRKQLMRGPDLHRLARAGDFNVEIDRNRLKPGENSFRITLHDLWGRKVTKEITIVYEQNESWPLPYEVDFSKVDNLQDVVEIVDGKWVFTEHGIRTAEPYYDRTLAFGDATWKDFELEAEIRFHRHFVGFENRQRQGPPYLSHAHTSFNMRWAGFPEDGTDPRRAWQSLGCLVALRCDLNQAKAGSYWWMHYGYARKGVPAKRSEMTPEQRFALEFEQSYLYRMRAETLEEGRTCYSTKVWKKGDPEPEDWQMVGIDESETVLAGSIVFVVHHSDVTLCRVRVQSLSGE